MVKATPVKQKRSPLLLFAPFPQTEPLKMLIKSKHRGVAASIAVVLSFIQIGNCCSQQVQEVSSGGDHPEFLEKEIQVARVKGAQ